MPGILITAGIYLRYHRAFAFAFGPNKTASRLGIVRIGGHIEAGETPVQCVRREALEETSLSVQLLHSPVTFHMETAEREPAVTLEEDLLHEIQPVLRLGQNVMFWAATTEQPQPAAETKGIILLKEEEIRKICSGNITYGEFLAGGGLSWTRQPYPEHFTLEPFAQLTFLARLLNEEPDIVSAVYGRE